jgi:glycine C-acetyltransferase/8-amino-7-oxononanoate synthase
MTPHAELESALAAFKGHDRALLFGSGYLANVGVITALTGPGDVVLSDALNHASIVDGCRQSRAQTLVYRHGDLDALSACLQRCAGRDAVIVTDAVFSMDGDLAPLAGIVELAERHGARVIVDEAHATGVVGPGGRGLVASLGLEDRVDVVVGTLGKALGSYGAFACCSAAIADLLVNRARTLIFSTALPPPSVAAARAALGLLVKEPARVQTLWLRARSLRRALAHCGLAVEVCDMPIVPLVLGAPEVAMAACERAIANGVFAQAIRPPTVPDGSSRLRLVACAGHTAAELEAAARTILAACRDA